MAGQTMGGGVSAFGQPATTQSSFGAFSNTNRNVFGTTTTPTFGQANEAAGFGFGTTPSPNLFGQSQPTTPFGQTNAAANMSLVGNTSGFRMVTTDNITVGTYIKFTPFIGADSILKFGVPQNIQTKLHCITCMKEYESKSLEELRFEDYTVGRKGGAQAQTTALFSATAQPPPFGNANAGPNTSTSTFGAIGGGFSASNQSGGTNLFNKPITGFTAPATTTSAFGFNAKPSTNLFGTNTNPFGVAISAPQFSVMRKGRAARRRMVISIRNGEETEKVSQRDEREIEGETNCGEIQKVEGMMDLIKNLEEESNKRIQNLNKKFGKGVEGVKGELKEEIGEIKDMWIFFEERWKAEKDRVWAELDELEKDPKEEGKDLIEELNKLKLRIEVLEKEKKNTEEDFDKEEL